MEEIAIEPVEIKHGAALCLHGHRYTIEQLSQGERETWTFCLLYKSAMGQDEIANPLIITPPVKQWPHYTINQKPGLGYFHNPSVMVGEATVLTEILWNFCILVIFLHPLRGEMRLSRSDWPGYRGNIEGTSCTGLQVIWPSSAATRP